ncbi:STAS/SEC14 domain-containing protein [Qipengyuania sp. S6317L1]|uniref:STAS/SEC14 domain-containing protein n=1 Tax=Qipengyuania sp. S6317L1 TaxID=2926410 RepID=UPI001FF6C059|nr:STAS/SEC14 domain-containing protein [Qipengyuania sp. S6317L1]MCK0098995.1 STAS/SEC14 domain-containing protein [Qipengyuania sp. S6317L1]
MINIETLSPKAVRITSIAEFCQADVETLVEFVQGHSDNGGGANLLIDATALTGFTLSAVTIELAHMPLFVKWLYSLDRIAIISDEEWIRTAARVESMVLPGVTYQVYDDDEKDAALAWVLEEEDAPHKGAFREIDLGRTDVAAFEVVGRLDGPESERGLAMVEDRLNDPKCAKLMMVIRHWHGFEAELLFSPKLMASKLKLIDTIERYAIVGGPGWVGGVAETMGHLIKPEIKAFGLDEEGEALKWLGDVAES